jgi:hypothetical protein
MRVVGRDKRSSFETHMSLTVFLAICVLGLDFMIFVLFQWLYGEKNRNRFRRSAARRHAAHSQTPLYYVSSRGNSRRRTARADWRAIPGRPRIVHKSDSRVSQIERNDRGAYQSIGVSLARKHA